MRLLIATLSMLYPVVLFGQVTDSAVAKRTCRIEVIDKESGWPVPLVELRTVHNMRFVSDNAGMIAIDDPDLSDREVFFHVEGHGYEVAADGFGIRGVRLTLRPGKTFQVEVTRTIVAKRIGRLTGSGLFVHSTLIQPGTIVKESGVVGCDSVQTAVHRGRRFWLWGDTSVARYPLGIFHSSAATTDLRPINSLKPPLNVSFDYFGDDKGRPRGVAKMPGSGPTWLSGMVSLPDRTGTPHLVATYVKIDPPLDAYECGLCVWNDKKEQFDRHKVIWTKSADKPKSPVIPDGHPAIHTDDQGQRWVTFGDPLPTLKCVATFEAWQDSSQWQALRPQTSLPAAHDGSPVDLHSGSIVWSAWRKRWVTVFMQRFGKPSAFGELWYAESESPTGPWGPAVKILSHNNYTFYNPRIHADFTRNDSPVLLFEGTYTQQFADKPNPTPRYDYNQILYRLDLDDARLKPTHQAHR